MTYLDHRAAALRAVRVDTRRNEFVDYEPITFERLIPENCDMYLRRLAAFGFLVKDGFSPFAVDVFDENADILDTFMITKKGFDYLRRKLRFRRDRA